MNIDKIETQKVRKRCLGYDRIGRQYWWSCDRIIIINATNHHLNNSIDSNNELDKVYYYSTRKQFNELLESLDGINYEKQLVKNLIKLNDEIINGFDFVYQLTMHTLRDKNLLNIKSWFELAIGNYYKENNIELKPINFKIITKLNKSANSRYPNELIYIWDDKNQYLKRYNKNYVNSNQSILSKLIFKLGMDSRDYVNLFNIHSIFLNKNQHQEEKDKKRKLSYKFSLTSVADFKWIDMQTGPNLILLHTLRRTLQNLETSIHTAFLSPNWIINRENWLTVVKDANETKTLAICLSIFESCIKPIAFNSVWYESLGFNFLERTTIADREERKKNEKRERKGMVLN